MSDEEFDREVQMAAAGQWEDLGLHAGPVPGFEKVPASEFFKEN